MSPAVEEKRPQRERVVIPISFDLELAQELRAQAYRQDEPVSIIVRRALRQYLEQFK